MKKSLILLPLAAVLLSLTGCKKDNEKSGPSGETVTLSATLGGGEKTEINGFDMKWSAGDAVTINKKKYTAKFALGYETAIFENVDAASEYEAYYPETLYDKGDDEYVLPAEQTYAGNTLSKINPMYAVTTTKTLQFNHICALVKLQVTGTGTVKTITVTSSKPLSGAFEIVDNHAEIISKDAASLTLKCGNEGVELSGDVNNPTIFYIAVPQNNYDDLQFTLSDGTNTWSPTSPVVKLLEAGKLYTKSLENVEFKKPAVFSVDGDGNTVTFAPGNLYYNGAGESNKMNSNLPSGWNFYEHQWDCYPSGTSLVTGSMEINLFTWGYGKDWSMVYDTYDYEESNKMTDWGSVAIGSDLPNTWRTLSKAEWSYLIGESSPERDPSLCKWSAVTFGDSGPTVSGLIIMPDGWAGTLSVTTGYTAWQSLESSGAVFLPAAGYRYGTDVGNVGSYGYYWSSSPIEDVEDYAYSMYFNSGYVYTDLGSRSHGGAVRLVR